MGAKGLSEGLKANAEGTSSTKSAVVNMIINSGLEEKQASDNTTQNKGRKKMQISNKIFVPNSTIDPNSILGTTQSLGSASSAQTP